MASYELEMQAKEHMASNNVAFEGKLCTDGELYRFSADHKKNETDEWYRCFEGISDNGVPYLICVYGTWSGGFQKHVFKSYEKDQSLSAEELEAIKKQSKLQQEEMHRRLEKDVEERIKRAQQTWERAADVPNSDAHMDYLSRKQVGCHDLKFGTDKKGNDVVIIPIKNIEGVIQGIQYIKSDGEKRIHGIKKGNFYLIGEVSDNSHIRVVEGYATGASVYEALKDPVAIAFDCGNLKPVVANLREKYPRHRITIMGDDDRSTEGNPGRVNAEAAAKAYSCEVVFPKFPMKETNGEMPSDFNDLHVMFGIEEVKKQLSRKRKLQAMDIKSFLSKKLPPRVIILDPWLPEQGLVMIFAERGIGKTFFALSIAYAMATEGTILNWAAASSKRVLYVDGEMPAVVLQERLLKISKSLHESPPNPLQFKIINTDFQEFGIRDIGTVEGQNDINEYMEEFDVLILDNLSSLLRSGEENVADSWQIVQDWLLDLRKAKKSVIFIHHAGKNKTPRGSSKREDILDTIIELRRPKNYSPEDGAKFEIHFKKTRGFEGEGAAPMEACLITNEEGGFEWTYKLIENRNLEQAIELTKEGLSQREIAVELEISPSTVNRLLKIAKEQGRFSAK